MLINLIRSCPIILYTVLISINTCLLHSQKQNIRFEHLSNEHGLSQNSVPCIVQDKKGFLWFGTYEGLNRYDGYKFKIYKSERDNPESLCHNTVQFLYEDHDGILWIGTDGGLDQYDRQKDKFVHYKYNPEDTASLSNNRIRWICEDQAGTLWIGTYGGGLNRLDRERKKFLRYQNNPADPNSIINDNIACVCISLSGDIWIAAHAGLSMFDPKKNVFYRYVHDPKNPNSLSGNDIYRVYEDQRGFLWVAVWNGNLERFDPLKNRFIHYRNRTGDPYSISSNIVQSFYEDRTGCFWMGTWGGGVNIYDREKDRFIHYESDPNDMNSISNNSVLSIYEDRTGIIWIGTDFGGINKYNRGRMKFKHYKKDPNKASTLSDNTIYSIAETNEENKKNLWIGTQAGGLDKFDKEKNRYTNYKNDPQDPFSLINNSVRVILPDRAGRIWIGTNKGLNLLDRRSEKFTLYIPDIGTIGRTNNDVFSLCKDKQGYIWIGTYGRGLYRLDPDKKKFTSFINESEDPQSLSDNIIRSILEDRYGTIWIGTDNGGLNRLNADNNSFTHYKNDPENSKSLSSNKVLCIYEDQSGALWLGTTIGLNKLERSDSSFIHYTEADGLPSNAIQSILEDGRGNLWLGTQKGLSKFDPGTNRFKNFKISDGLQSNEFTVNACLKSRDGEMFFGGTNGFNSFHPDSISTNLLIPPVVIESFHVFNKSVSAGEDIDGHVILENSIIESSELSLTYRENSFAFEFASLDFTSPEENKYAYMMEGFDEKWNYTDADRRFASYTNMSGGDYVFRVKGSNNDGIWNDGGTSIHVAIESPFWKTLWFYALCIIVVVSAGASAYRYRMYRVRMIERNLKKKVDERTRELAREVAEHRRAEEALLLLDTAIESAANAIVITDRDGKIISVNQAFTRITGYTPEDAIGQKTNILNSGRHPDLFFQNMWETILSGEVWKGEIENKRKDGSLYTEEMTITPVRQAGGEISHFIAIKQDITEQKKLQSQILQSQKIQSIGTLAGGIAHDFNNILSIILGYASLLETRLEKNKKLLSNIKTIEQAADRGTALVRQILTFARKTNVLFESLDISESVHELISMLQQTFPRTITFRVQIEDSIPLIWADRSQIHQLLLNLYLNARDAMPDGGTITLSAVRKTRAQVQERFPAAGRKAYVCVSISDTGEGIPKEMQRRVFDPFFTTKDQGKGSGLGLSVVFGIVEAHHSFIDIESESGLGTTFHIYFPVSEIEEQPAEKGVFDKNRKKGGTETVLLVEDEESILNMFYITLKSGGYTVYSASDGIKAIEIYQKHMQEIALVITDMGLPEMSGENEFKKLREINANVKVILVSGFWEPETKSRLVEAGADGILQKPCKPDEILGLVRQVLDKTS